MPGVQSAVRRTSSNLSVKMPLGSLIKNLAGVGDQPSEKNESVMVAESLLMELDYQMKEADELLRIQELEEKKAKMGVDYSWLVNDTHKVYEMPQMERLELEELCIKIKPEESNRVITTFRHGLLREPPIKDMPRIMRACIVQVLDTRQKEETMSEWVRRSLTKLRPSSSRSKITPVSSDEGVDLEDNTNSSQGGSMLFCNSPPAGADGSHMSVDDLPV